MTDTLVQESLRAATGKERREAYALLRDAARPDVGVLGWAAFYLLIAALLEALGPYFGKLLIDNNVVPRHGTWGEMVILVCAAFAATTAASWLRYFQLVRLAGLAMRSVQRIRERVYAHVLRLPMSFFDGVITGQLVSRVTNDTQAVKALYVQVLFVFLDAVITIGGVFALMFWLNWRLSLIAVAMIPAVLLVVGLYQRFSAHAVAHARELRSTINAQLAESIQGMSVLQASNAAPRFSARLERTSWAHYEARFQEVRANAWLLRPMLDALSVILLVVVILIFGLQSEGGLFGAIEVGVLYAFISYLNRVAEPMINITMQFSQFQQSVVAASRVNTLLRQSEAPEIHTDDATRRISRGEVSIQALDFAYARGPRVLHGIDAKIPAGAFWGIVGHTGSGKSTLLSLLLRFYELPAESAGQIKIDGIPLESIDEDHFRDAVALVPQEPFLLAASAYENINMGRGLSRARVEWAARAALAHEFITQLEHGYDTALGEGGTRLSVGQKQLIAIARSIAGKAKVLLLDEATSHIDSETEVAVQKAIAALKGQVTVIAIAHRLSTIRDADHILVLNHGQVAERGDHASLMAIDGGIYQRLYELQRIEADL